MKLRYIKVWRDLTADYSKNLMLVLAIGIGVFGIGAILGGYSVINREMRTNYMSTNPASATIELEQNISTQLLDSVKKFSGIADAERRATPTARMKVGDKWYPLLLFVVDDFSHLRMNKFHFLSGAENPATGEILAERTALGMMNAQTGESILVKTANSNSKEVKIAGVVHDPGLAPAWQEQSGYAYVTMETLHWLGETQGFDQLRISVEGEQSADAITKKASEVAAWLKSKNYEVHEIQVPPPGKHPHQSQMNAVLSIFTTFAFLILILGSILVSASMATLMVKQVRQIGVMKTIGGNSSQMAAMYLVMMVVICVVALLISIPLSRLAAALFYSQIATLLNLEITNTSIPTWVLMTQVVSGIFIPLIAAAFPVIRGSRISVRKALDNFGVSGKPSKMLHASWWSETFTLSVRNVFRQRSRLAMTLGLLATGGAMFMTALNVSKAWNTNLKRIYEQRLYDQEIKLNQSIDADLLIQKIKSIKGVKQAEAWSYSSTGVAKENSFDVSRTYPDKGHGSFTMLALPVNSKLLNPTVKAGRWLQLENENEVVLNQMVRGSNRDLKVGDEIKLSIDGKAYTWKIVGLVEDVGSGAAAYVSKSYFEKITNSDGQSKMLRISYEDRSRQNAVQKNKEIEKLLEDEKISVNGSIPVWLLQNAIAAHMKVLVNSLLAMAVLMAIVGTLALLSTMSMNVMERTREIGVMRAIGATPQRIRSLIIWEGIIIGVMSIFIAVVLALVFSTFMGRFIGNMSFRTPLSLIFSELAFVIWVVIILVGSYLATLYPSRRAIRLTTREALSYE